VVNKERKQVKVVIAGPPGSLRILVANLLVRALTEAGFPDTKLNLNELEVDNCSLESQLTTMSYKEIAERAPDVTIELVTIPNE
jgi:hypothetical protein